MNRKEFYKEIEKELTSSINKVFVGVSHFLDIKPKSVKFAESTINVLEINLYLQKKGKLSRIQLKQEIDLSYMFQNNNDVFFPSPGRIRSIIDGVTRGFIIEVLKVSLESSLEPVTKETKFSDDITRDFTTSSGLIADFVWIDDFNNFKNDKTFKVNYLGKFEQPKDRLFDEKIIDGLNYHRKELEEFEKLKNGAGVITVKESKELLAKATENVAKEEEED